MPKYSFTVRFTFDAGDDIAARHNARVINCVCPFVCAIESKLQEINESSAPRKVEFDATVFQKAVEDNTNRVEDTPPVFTVLTNRQPKEDDPTFVLKMGSGDISHVEEDGKDYECLNLI